MPDRKVLGGAGEQVGLARRLAGSGLVESSPSPSDGRAPVVTLTDTGREAFRELDERSVAQIDQLIEPLSGDQLSVVAEATTMIAEVVHPRAAERSVSFRGLEAGDMDG